MNAELISLFIILSILWFVIYWVLGGVFFAVITVMRLGRLRKVRFSCLFTLLSLGVGTGAAYLGMEESQEAVGECLVQATTNAEKMTAVLGCGFASVFGMFLLGAVVLTIGGFFIMMISKSKSKPWIVLDHEEHQEEVPSPQNQESGGSKGHFFEG